MRGLQATRPAILMIILLVWIGLPVSAWPPSDLLTTQAGNSAHGAVQNADVELSLEPGKPVERELSGGQSHFYKITMTSGQYLRITVRQQGIDVIVALSTPDGKKMGEVDGERATVGAETVSAIAETAGAYRIEVRSAEKTAQTGRYEIKSEELREAIAEDKYRVSAESLSREAGPLKEGTLEAKRKSIEKYHEALELYRRSSDRNGEAQTLSNIGEVHCTLGEMQKALEKFNEALPLRRAIGDRRGEAETLTNIGAVYWSLGGTQKALAKYNEALPLRRAVGDRRGEADTLNSISVAYQYMGETQKALEKHNEVLLLRRAVGDRQGEAVTLNNIGEVYRLLGEMQKALEKHNEVLPLRRAIGDRHGEAVTLSNIGGVYGWMGEE